jgi:8-amino-7-oxononanoate synthase
MDAERKTLWQNSLSLGLGVRPLLGDLPGVLATTTESNDDLRLGAVFQAAAKMPGYAAVPAAPARTAGSPGATRQTQIVPVVLGSNEAALSAAAFLQEQGFAVRAIRPPTVPVGSARLRLSLTARVTHEHVSGILAALKAWRTSQWTVASAGHG